MPFHPARNLVSAKKNHDAQLDKLVPVRKSNLAAFEITHRKLFNELNYFYIKKACTSVATKLYQNAVLIMATNEVLTSGIFYMR